MPEDFNASVIPVAAKFNYDFDAGQFRMRVSTQIKRPDGTHYEVEIETSADLGALVTTLFQIWTGTGQDGSPITAMLRPSAVVMPDPDSVTYGGLIDVGIPGEVGSADPADDVIDADLV